MAVNGKIELYQDKKGEWRWRRHASNGKIVGASSEGYRARADAEANASRSNPNDKWEFYQDKKSEWRWRCFATNGQQVGRASEGYKARRDCENNARSNGWTG